MAISAPPLTRRPKPKETWDCVRSLHRGWKVLILAVNEHRVSFEVLGGPGKSLRSRHRLPMDAFISCYQPRE